MTLQITIFDIEEQPLKNHPVELLQNGQVISTASTDNDGVVEFNTTFTHAPDLAVRSQQHQLPR